MTNSVNHNSIHPENTGLPGIMHHDDTLETMATESDAVIPTPVAQHGMICDDRYNVDKYKYDSSMEFNTLSQRYLAGDMNIGGQGQILGSSIGLHGLKDTSAYTLASHPFSIQRLLPGANDAKTDMKMFEMSPYGGYATLGPGHGKATFYYSPLFILIRALGHQCAPHIFRLQYHLAHTNNL